MGCGQKSFKLVRRCHQLLSGFLAKCHFPRTPRHSRLLANDMVIMRLYWGLRKNLLAFTLRLRKTTENVSWEPFWWALCYKLSPQMGSLTSKWGRKDRTVRQEGKDGIGNVIFPPLFIFHYLIVFNILFYFECCTKRTLRYLSELKPTKIHQNDTYISKIHVNINNLREKFSPGPGFELGSPALCAGALTNWATQTIHGPS